MENEKNIQGGKIYQAIAKVMSEVGAVSKSKQTQQGDKYMYRGIDDVMNALNPSMSKNGIFIVPKITSIEREARTTRNGGNLTLSILTMEFTFYAEDGSNVTAIIIGEAFDSGDKSINKAMSVAYKYACFQVFCIPTEEMNDPDAEVHDVEPKSSQNQSKANNSKPATNKPQNDGKNEAKTSPEHEPTEEYIEKIKHQKIGEIKIKVIEKELERTGVLPELICKTFGVATIQDITEEMFLKVKAKFEKTPDKK